ncbi:MAG TPA: FAD-dependent monooxygenase [Pseudonocardia sp.]|jgi:2-polyprenyl-6-methoxyphenol hydroxylase-like FAD-dependent oxidoreductase|nr:FAD-dependent monooxygenase [Pseudonocardia sp.]
MVDEYTDVVIVGAGLAGLSTAVFLGLHGVPALVVDRHPSTSVQPKARGQNPLVMEALRTAGVADEILAAAPPGRAAVTIVISESMSGPVLHRISESYPDLTPYSPAPAGLASQARAEAALATRARELGARLSFRTRCETIAPDPDGVTVLLRSLDRDAAREVRARYVVAADGHRGGLRELAGIGSHGRGLFERMTTVRFTADLSAWASGDAVVLHYLRNPALPGGSGVIVSTDHPGEWVAGMAADPDRDEARTAAVIRTLVGVPDLALEVLGGATWDIGHRVADRFRAGRVLLVGDAAHVMPPTGGQGGNTALADGYHLAWKLAAVLRGDAGPALLDSHDTERRPYAEAMCDWQVANMVVRQRPDLADESIGEPMDAVVLGFGYACPAGAFVPEPGADAAMFEDPNEPTGRPGTRVPHVELAGADGPVWARDLLGPYFLVFTGAADGVATARTTAAELDLSLRAYAVTSAAPLGAGPGDTVLVRPDGIVAWRGTDPADLGKALRTVLHR